MAAAARTPKYMYKTAPGNSGELSIEYGTDLGALTRLEDKVRLLQEDLDGERELRQRIEREKSDLMVQLMQLSERLDDAEGSSESKAEMNKKRDAEMANRPQNTNV